MGEELNPAHLRGHGVGDLRLDDSIAEGDRQPAAPTAGDRLPAAVRGSVHDADVGGTPVIALGHTFLPDLCQREPRLHRVGLPRDDLDPAADLVAVPDGLEPSLRLDPPHDEVDHQACEGKCEGPRRRNDVRRTFQQIKIMHLVQVLSVGLTPLYFSTAMATSSYGQSGRDWIKYRIILPENRIVYHISKGLSRGG